jgi:GNAT superfamily N-acetyltransferase
MPKVGERVKLKPEYRFLLPQEVPLLKGWKKRDKEIDEYVFTMTRWQKWEAEPPIVCVLGLQIVGYHGVSFTASGYANSMSQFVLPEHRGKGYASAMINFLLTTADERGMSRLRFRTPKSGPGLDVWTGLGAVPFGEAEGDYWFDLRIQGVTSLQKFLGAARTLHLPPTEDKRRIGYYRKAGVQPLIDEYVEVLC